MVKRTNVAPFMPAAVVPDGLAFVIVDEVAPTGQLEPSDTAALDLRLAVEGEDVVLCRDVMVVVREQRES